MFHPPSFTYADEKGKQNDLVVLIFIVVALYALYRSQVIAKYAPIYVLIVLVTFVVLFGYDFLRRSGEIRQSWIANRRKSEAFEEQRRQLYRSTLKREPWRSYLPPTPQGANSCPNVLVRKEDGKFYLYNTSMPDTVITNPIVFKSISEYIVFWKEQKKLPGGADCPVAYLQEDLSNDPQYYEVELDQQLKEAQAMDRLSKQVRFYLPEETQNADREPAPLPNGDGGGLPGADVVGSNNNQGVWTEADEKALRTKFGGYQVPVHRSAQGVGAGIPGVSANPMDSNWGGGMYSSILLNEGYFRHGSRANIP